MYLTLVDREYENADVYFPEINESDWDKEYIKSNEDNGIPYKHVLYKRK